MRTLLLALLLMAAATGCVHRKRGSAYSTTQAPSALNQPASNQPGQHGTPGLIVTPENQLIGKVAMVNSAGRFIVINFPVGRMPLVDQHLNLYRRGLKVGEVKITGPQQDDNIVGDLVSGESEPGDEVRAQ